MESEALIEFTHLLSAFTFSRSAFNLDWSSSNSSVSSSLRALSTSHVALRLSTKPESSCDWTASKPRRVWTAARLERASSDWVFSKVNADRSFVNSISQTVKLALISSQSNLKLLEGIGVTVVFGRAPDCVLLRSWPARCLDARTTLASSASATSKQLLVSRSCCSSETTLLRCPSISAARSDRVF